MTPQFVGYEHGAAAEAMDGGPCVVCGESRVSLRSCEPSSSWVLPSAVEKGMRGGTGLWSSTSLRLPFLPLLLLV